MKQTDMPCSNKARKLLALQCSTDAQSVSDEGEVEEALFFIDEGGESSFGRGWKADNAINTVAEKTDREGTDLHNSTRE